MPDIEYDPSQVIVSVTTLLGDEKKWETLKDEDHYNDVLKELNLPQSAWKPLLQLLSRVEHLVLKTAKPGGQTPNQPPGGQTPNQPPGGKTHRTDDVDYEKMQLEGFDHIKVAFWISMSMSVGVFAVGLVLMGFAVYQSMRQDSFSLSALTIGGLGLADFVLLFMRRPWRDVSINLSNSQQVRTITTTYLSGLALIQRGDTKGMEMLDGLTKRSVTLLQKYTEEPDPDK